MARAHANDIDTSHKAAKQAGGTAKRHKGMVLECLLVYGPQTSQQIADRLELTSLQVMKRISDLRDDDKVIDSGERGKSLSGRATAVWKLKTRRRS